MDNPATLTGNHSIYLEDRKKITITDVKNVGTFNEENVHISLKTGAIVVKGHNLHIQKLDLEEGKAVITGFINSTYYTEKKDKKEGSLLSRMFK